MLTQGLSQWAGKCDESSIDCTCGTSEGGVAWVADSAGQQKTKEDERRGFLPSVVGCIIAFDIRRLSSMPMSSLPCSRVAPSTMPINE